MFYKQMVRCPYLLESEELQIFIRPHMDVERALTYLPKLNPHKFLEKITPYYSMMGEIDNDALQPINLSINAFCVQCKKNLSFLEKFRETVDKTEGSFDSSWGGDNKLNNYFFIYEKDVLSDYMLSLNSQNKKGIKGLV